MDKTQPCIIANLDF